MSKRCETKALNEKIPWDMCIVNKDGKINRKGLANMILHKEMYMELLCMPAAFHSQLRLL